jgi:DNA-binding transcriptional LysR family regulator
MDRLVHDFTTQNPKANVRLEYHHPDKIYELVENDQVDFGLVSYPKASRTLMAIPWRDEPMVMVCSPNHAFAQETSLPLAALEEQKLVTFDSGLKIRRDLDKALSAAEVVPEIVLEFDNIENIKRAVEINAGVALLPEPTIVREVADGSLMAIEIKDAKLLRPLGMIQRKGVELGKTARRFIELLLHEHEEARAATDSGQRETESHSKASA